MTILCSLITRPSRVANGPTELVQHVGDIFPVYGAVAVPVQDLEAFAQGAHLCRL